MSLNNVPGEPNWIELFTTDPPGAYAFYGDLLGWAVQETGPEFGGYALFLREGEPVGGCMRNEGQGISAWHVYLESDDVEATVAMAEANGGQVVVPPMQVGELGHMAEVVDPSGAAVGIWQPGQHQGFAVRGEVGAPAWFEVLSHDYEAAIPFYENVFGWDTHTMSDAPEFRYTTLGKDEHALAGIMDARGHLDEPSHWTFHLQVEDADATLERALALGGSRVPDTGPHTTPYGRIAVVADPAGVTFSVLGPNRS